MLSDAEEIAANLTAMRYSTTYSIAILVVAITERGPDRERLFALFRTVAEAFRQSARTTAGGAAAVRGHTLAAEIVEEVERTVLNMSTKPPGAGTA